MARGIQTKNIWKRNQKSRTDKSVNDYDVLKNRVRDGLLSMTVAERGEFIQALETEMQRVRLSICTYLIPLGIPARKPDELTPLEAAHLIRFLKINIPQAMPAIEKAMARFGAFAEKEETSDHWLAA